MKVSVITVSDSSFVGERTDASGPLLVSFIKRSQRFNVENIEECIVPDEKDQIIESLIHHTSKSDVIFTTGGTGFSPRDVTPECTEKVIQKRCGGLETALHVKSLQMTPMAALSRLCVGIRNKTLIVNLPGSPRAVKDCFEVIEGILEHAVDLIKGNKVFH